MMRRSYVLVFAVSYSGFKGGGGSKNHHPRFMKFRSRNAPATKIKFHCRQRPWTNQRLVNYSVVEFEHKIALVVTSPARGSYAERAVVILPYGTMAAVESTSVTSVLIHYCCGSFDLFGGLWEKLYHLARIGSDETALDLPQPR